MKIVCDTDKIMENISLIREKTNLISSEVDSFANGFNNGLAGWSGDGKTACENICNQTNSKINECNSIANKYADYLKFIVDNIVDIENSLKNENFS